MPKAQWMDIEAVCIHSICCFYSCLSDILMYSEQYKTRNLNAMTANTTIFHVLIGWEGQLPDSVAENDPSPHSMITQKHAILVRFFRFFMYSDQRFDHQIFMRRR